MLRRIARLYRDAFSGLPRDLWVLAFIALVNRSGTMVLPFLGLYFTREQGLGVAEAGRLIACYGLGSILGAWIGGWLSDRIGALATQKLSLTATGVGFMLFPLLRDPAVLAVGIFVVSVIAESFRPANMTEFAHRAAPGMQGRAFALLRLAANVGMAIGPAVGGILALYSYVWLFVGDAVTCWAAALLLVLWIRPLPAEPEPAADVAAAPPRARPPWRDAPFLALMAFVLLLAMCVFQVFSTLPLYLGRELGYREDAVGRLLALNAVLIVLFEMVLIHWAERHDRMRIVAVGSFLLCAGLGVLPLGRGPLFVAATVVVWSVGEMLALPLVNAVVADRAGRGMRGRYMGLYTMTFGGAFFLGPALGTWLYEHHGPATLWYAVGATAVPLVLGALALRAPLRARP